MVVFSNKRALVEFYLVFYELLSSGPPVLYVNAFTLKATALSR
jgi:hypothetical protein